MERGRKRLGLFVVLSTFSFPFRTHLSFESTFQDSPILKRHISLFRLTCVKCNSKLEADTSLEPNDECHVKMDILGNLLFGHDIIYFFSTSERNVGIELTNKTSATLYGIKQEEEEVNVN